MHASRDCLVLVACLKISTRLQWPPPSRPRRSLNFISGEADNWISASIAPCGTAASRLIQPQGKGVRGSPDCEGRLEMTRGRNPTMQTSLDCSNTASGDRLIFGIARLAVQRADQDHGAIWDRALSESRTCLMCVILSSIQQILQKVLKLNTSNPHHNINIYSITFNLHRTIVNMIFVNSAFSNSQSFVEV